LDTCTLPYIQQAAERDTSALLADEIPCTSTMQGLIMDTPPCTFTMQEMEIKTPCKSKFLAVEKGYTLHIHTVTVESGTTSYVHTLLVVERIYSIVYTPPRTH
jgi:hypothetical protein